MTSVRALAHLLREAQAGSPEDVVANLANGAATLGGHDLVLYLIDYDQQVLQPTPEQLANGEPVPTASVHGTMAGRCFATQTLLEAPLDDGRAQLWVPVSERAERLGVLTMTVDAPDDQGRALAVELGLLAALLVLTASAYCDRFHLQRRRKDLSLAAEMQWGLLPPLSFSFEGTTVAGLLEPAYEVGGDCFDYALNEGIVSLAVFDAMGHGVHSSVVSGLAVGAYRHARRKNVPLPALFDTMDRASAGLMGDSFVTALAAELDVATGRLSWVCAGHPSPLIFRDGSMLPEMALSPTLPLGLALSFGELESSVAQVALQPGDRVLLYTDGVVEARDPAGEEFGLGRLADHFVRESSSGLLASEILRRLVRTCLEFQGAQLRDDATLLLLEWAGPPQQVAAQRPA